ncbi:MAG: M1 family metallopeptidase [Deltaproteobacteria bacterium]|nr:M1 family metallopeptidase [Deltaproteobacteria bacterium]
MKGIAPIHYTLVIEPDLDRFSFSGTAEIMLKASDPVKRITLDAMELLIRSCMVKVNGEFVPCRFSMNPKNQKLLLSLPGDLSGDIALRIEYEGRINDKLAGFYRSRYKLQGREKTMAVTQFQESDARRAFPCLDHPGMKATFDVELIVDASLTAISNGAVVEETPVGDARKRVRFERTPRMSTYLLFFGVGEFNSIKDSEDERVRVVAPAGLIRYGGYGLDFGRKSLQFCEDFFGIGYALSKMDLISVPDFAFGAMENWGAITFRENLLLHFPGITSAAGEGRICEVIAHEIVHQWFGNLVTPSEWRYLWLNESFATFFGFDVVDHYHPEWQIWEQFLSNQTDPAMDRDSLHETFAIELPGDGHVEINPSTAPIIYNKGAGILRQVKGYIGDEAFQGGLRHYLSAHQYDCASSSDLWESLESASGKPVTHLMKGWIEQPGFPLVTAKRDGGSLILDQRRFTYLPNDSAQVWPIPISIRLFYSDNGSSVVSMLMDEKSAEVPMEGDPVAFKVNEGQPGFFRVRYADETNLEELGKRVFDRTLGPEDRWGLQNDLFAMAMAGNCSMDRYLGFLDHYREETDFLPLASIASNLHSGYMTLGEACRGRIAKTGKGLFDAALSAIAMEPQADERHVTALLRDQLLAQAVRYGSAPVERFALEKALALKSGKEIHPDIMKSTLQVGAMKGDAAFFTWLVSRLESTESEHERSTILLAMGSLGDEKLLERARAYVLAQVPDRNKFIPIAAMCGNPKAVPHMWEWFMEHLAELERFHPIHYGRVIAAVVSRGGIGREAEVRSFFADYADRHKSVKDVILLALEKLEINRRFRENNG